MRWVLARRTSRAGVTRDMELEDGGGRRRMGEESKEGWHEREKVDASSKCSG